MRNGLEQLTESHKPRALKPLGQNSDLRMCGSQFGEAGHDARGKDFLHSLKPYTLGMMREYVQQSLSQAQQTQKLKYEPIGFIWPIVLTLWGGETGVELNKEIRVSLGK